MNNTLLEGKSKVKFKTKIINQSSYHDLGIDTITHSIVDVPINKLIKASEKKYGVISLGDCDFKIPVNLHTDCDKNVDKNFRNEFIVNYRNDFIVKSTNEHPNNKITLIYGKMHFLGIKKILKEQVLS